MRPRCSDQLDFEGEMVVFIDRSGRDIWAVDCNVKVRVKSDGIDVAIADAKMSRWPRPG